jgi:hypothetical protein
MFVHSVINTQWHIKVGFFFLRQLKNLIEFQQTTSIMRKLGREHS